MIYIFLGVAAFVFFVLYDINSIIMKNKCLSRCFFIGFFLLAAATAGLFTSTWDMHKNDILRMIFFGLIAVIFLALLIHSLFFALPFQKTYLDFKKTAEVCRTGVYALCRHPGVLWFTGFYLCMGFALGASLALTAAAVFSCLNFLYVIFQDLWTFPKCFKDYREYKKDTPFLLPNANSIKHCIQSLGWKEGSIHEL